MVSMMCVGWRCVPALVKRGFQPAYGAVHPCTHVDVWGRVHVRQCTLTYGTVSCGTSMQDTANANYMLLTIVVNGHNCVAVRRHMANGKFVT